MRHTSATSAGDAAWLSTAFARRAIDRGSSSTHRLILLISGPALLLQISLCETSSCDWSLPPKRRTFNRSVHFGPIGGKFFMFRPPSCIDD